MKVSSLIAIVLLAAAAGAHAQGMSMPMKPAASAPQSSVPLVDAKVKKVDLKKGLLVLDHGDLPNLGMPAMTMGFDVADRKMLQGVKVGQKVKFQAEIIGGKATVTELKPAG
ncbi:copper-binding protein [Ramlibacter algicola]|uniref:Copper-binding protein n=1 Tax=Ramlibacter algicola TaxID=2795217 RepID=A0A934Q4T3_9BURK|nr:copper-binding protein [Ramlibacter algicola]MBK0394923.1 copper-binding protein [Ramlibacter algicola]